MKSQKVNLQSALSLRNIPAMSSIAQQNTDEEKAINDLDNKCPNAPSLKPRNQCFKFNSAKNFSLAENLTEYTPFFYSEGEESSEGDNEESTQDFMNNFDDF